MSVSTLIAEAIPELLLWSFELVLAAARGVRFVVSPSYRLDVQERWKKDGRLVMFLEVLAVAGVWVLWIGAAIWIYALLTG